MTIVDRTFPGCAGTDGTGSATGEWTAQLGIRNHTTQAVTVLASTGGAVGTEGYEYNEQNPTASCSALTVDPLDTLVCAVTCYGWDSGWVADPGGALGANTINAATIAFNTVWGVEDEGYFSGWNGVTVTGISYSGAPASYGFTAHATGFGGVGVTANDGLPTGVNLDSGVFAPNGFDLVPDTSKGLWWYDSRGTYGEPMVDANGAWRAVGSEHWLGSTIAALDGSQECRVEMRVSKPVLRGDCGIYFYWGEEQYFRIDFHASTTQSNMMLQMSQQTATPALAVGPGPSNPPYGGSGLGTAWHDSTKVATDANGLVDIAFHWYPSGATSHMVTQAKLPTASTWTTIMNYTNSNTILHENNPTAYAIRTDLADPIIGWGDFYSATFSDTTSEMLIHSIKCTVGTGFDRFSMAVSRQAYTLHRLFDSMTPGVYQAQASAVSDVMVYVTGDGEYLSPWMRPDSITGAKVHAIYPSGTGYLATRWEQMDTSFIVSALGEWTNHYPTAAITVAAPSGYSGDRVRLAMKFTGDGSKVGFYSVIGDMTKLQMSASATGAGSEAATMTQAVPLTAGTLGHGSAAGEITVPILDLGSVAGSGTGLLSATISQVVQMASSAGGTGAVSAVVGYLAVLAATAAGTGQVSAALGGAQALSAASAGAGASTGLLGGLIPLTASAQGSGVAQAALVGLSDLLAAASGHGSAGAVLGDQASLTASVSGAGYLSAVLSQLAVLQGDSIGAGEVDATLGMLLSLAAQSAGSSSATALLSTAASPGDLGAAIAAGSGGVTAAMRELLPLAAYATGHGSARVVVAGLEVYTHRMRGAASARPNLHGITTATAPEGGKPCSN